MPQLAHKIKIEKNCLLLQIIPKIYCTFYKFKFISNLFNLFKLQIRGLLAIYLVEMYIMFLVLFLNVNLLNIL